jgi:hypothetical protein
MKNRNELFTEINNGLDLTKIDFEKLDRAQLIEYAYALDWNGCPSSSALGHHLPITKKELIEAIKNLILYI